jgi:ATP-dependent helicase/DNAse subunit B
MIVTYIRSSSYNNYDFCQMQYFLTYVLGHRSDSNKKADMGTMAHKVMEILAGLKKFQQDNPRKKYLEIVDDKCGKIRVHKDELYKDDFVNEMCVLAVDAYADGSIHKFYPADRKVVTETVFTFLTHSDGLFDPRKRNIYHPEAQFDIPIEEDWAKFEYEIDGKKVCGQLAIKGTIDLTTLIADDTIEVVDWKTGRRMDWTTGQVKDYKKLENDPQLLLYFYAISKLYKDFPNRIMSIFFYKDKDGKVDPMPFSICLGPEDEKRFLKMLRKRFEEIRDNVLPQPLRSDRSSFKCQKLCHFYKNNWEGTDEKMCIFIEKKLKKDGMEKTIQDCTKDGFSIGYYEAPG